MKAVGYRPRTTKNIPTRKVIKKPRRKILIIILITFGSLVTAFFIAVFVVFIISIFNSTNSATQIAPAGHSTIAKLLNAPAGSEYQIYPNKLLTQVYENYTSQSPIPPIADLEPGTPSSLISFTTSTWSQQDLVSRCYDTWKMPIETGGKICGTDTVDADPGQCTFWALFNYDSLNIYKIISYTYVLNADRFMDIAQANGVPTSQTPSVGSMVAWKETPGLYGSVGHVAIVVAVNQNKKTYVVSEMNYAAPWSIDYRVVSSVPGGIGYGNLLGFILP